VQYPPQTSITITAWNNSLEAYDNPAVRKFVAKNFPNTVPFLRARPFLRAAPLEGPFPSVQAWCKQHIASAEGDTAEARRTYIEEHGGTASAKHKARELYRCECPDKGIAGDLIEGGMTLKSVAPTWSGVDMFATACSDGDVSTPDDKHLDMVLALKDARGWFFAIGPHLQHARHDEEQVSQLDAGTRDGGREVLWSYTTTVADRTTSVIESDVIIIGVGKSGKPSATRPIPVASSSTRADDESKADATARKLTWNKRGQLVVRGKGDGDDALAPGAHTIEFP
jgi:hypothetical protein